MLCQWPPASYCCILRLSNCHSFNNKSAFHPPLAPQSGNTHTHFIPATFQPSKKKQLSYSCNHPHLLPCKLLDKKMQWNFTVCTIILVLIFLLFLCQSNTEKCAHRFQVWVQCVAEVTLHLPFELCVNIRKQRVAGAGEKPAKAIAAQRWASLSVLCSDSSMLLLFVICSRRCEQNWTGIYCPSRRTLDKRMLNTQLPAIFTRRQTW